MRKNFIIVFMCVLICASLTACGANNSNKLADEGTDVTTLPEVTESIERPDDSDIIAPTTEVTTEPTTEAPIVSPSNGGIGVVINKPTRTPDAVQDDVEMWINGDGTFTYSLAWREIWLTCSTNVFENIHDGIRGPYYDESVPATRFGWEKVVDATYSFDANGTTYVIKPNEFISGSPSGTSAYAGIYYSDMNSDFFVSIRNPDATFCTYEFYSCSGVWNIDSIVFYSYMCEAASINPNADMFEGIIPDYFDQGFGNSYTITYQSISN